MTTGVFYRFADQVSVGDEMLVEVNDEITPAMVTNVSNLILQGKYLERLQYMYPSSKYKIT